MPGNITFATNSADLERELLRCAEFREHWWSTSSTRRSSKSPATPIARAPTPTTSSSPSVVRSAVAAYLGTRSVLPDRIITVGMGEARPVATNDTDVGRQQNRRVELTLVPLTVS